MTDLGWKGIVIVFLFGIKGEAGGGKEKVGERKGEKVSCDLG